MKLMNVMDDLISRQAAIEAVHDAFDECLVWDESGATTADEVEHILGYLPSAEPERKRGKWIDKNTPTENYCPRYECSICGNWSNHSNFCPYCGADMRKV